MELNPNVFFFLVFLTFGGGGTAFSPYLFRQYSTHVWYGLDVFGHPLTDPVTCDEPSDFSLSNDEK